ncbi:hypothetical protein AA0243_0360 [Novacetimonas hansenii NRIC 0243]|nr:hypothetical protein AA0243_0360 [Novacetimonas hansenii NRIC 0243]
MLRKGVFAPAKTNLQPDFTWGVAKGVGRVGHRGCGKAHAGQRQIKQALLARTQGMATLAPVQAIG